MRLNLGFEFLLDHWESMLSFVVLVGSAVILLYAQRGKTIHKTDTANITSLSGLLGTRDIEKEELTRKLDLVTSEYKQIISVNIKEITNTWERSQSSALRGENARLRDEIHQLEDDLQRARSKDV